MMLFCARITKMNNGKTKAFSLPRTALAVTAALFVLSIVSVIIIRVTNLF